jgi:hypothetical protein
MDWPGHPSPERAILEAVLEAARRAGGRWPVYQYLDLVLHQQGIDRPDQRLEEISSDLVRFDAPLAGSSEIGLTVPGCVGADPSAREVHHGFLKVLRKLFDRWEREPFLSPAQEQPVVVPAQELWSPQMGSSTELRMVGLLLEIEQVGKVGWTGDPQSPFDVEIGFRIRRYGVVGVLADYLRVRPSVAT